MSGLKQIKCHQFIAGRFHEGYGRVELSISEEDGRRTQTLHDGLNLDGRNNYNYTGYRAYEIEPTHLDLKRPGVFCISNEVENGTQAARTYGLIPASEDIEDAFSILKGRPFLPFEEFTEYDIGRKALTWSEKSWPHYANKDYILSEAAEGWLGLFLTSYWNTMAERMMDPDCKDMIALHLTFQLQDAEKEENEGNWLFQEQVDFFLQNVVRNLPKAVQEMTSVVFGASWLKRKIHPAAACVVISDEKERNANPIYSFVIKRSDGKYIVDTGEDLREARLADRKRDPEIAAILLGHRTFPEVYKRLEKYYESRPGESREILRSYEVIELLSQLEAWGEEWRRIPENGRHADANKYYKRFKPKYLILFKTLVQKCLLGERDAFDALQPLFDLILSVTSKLSESEFDLEDLPFFAGCCRIMEGAMNDEDVSGEYNNRIEQCKKVLTDHYIAWSEKNFASDIIRQKDEKESLIQKEIFVGIAQAALTSQKIPSQTINQVQDFFKEHYALDETSVTEKIFVHTILEKDIKDQVIDEEYIQKWCEWLSTCKVNQDMSHRMEYLHLLYSDALKNDKSSISSEYAAGFYIELLDPAICYDEDGKKELKSAAESFLISHFEEWAEESFSAGEIEVPKTVFLEITRSAFENQEIEMPSETIEQVMTYFAAHYKIDEESEVDKECVRLLVRRNLNHQLMDEELIQKWESWLFKCGIKKDIDHRLEYLEELYLTAFNKESMVSPTYAASVYIDLLDPNIQYERQIVEELLRKANNYLVEHFHDWAESHFEARQKNQAKVWKPLFSASMEWLKGTLENEPDQSDEDLEKNRRTIDELKKYLHEIHNLDGKEIEAVAEQIIIWESQHNEINVEEYKSQENWVKKCKVKDDRALALLLPLAEKLTDDDIILNQTSLSFLGEHMEKLSKYKENWEQREKKKADEIISREFQHLLDHFSEWREELAESGNSRQNGSEQLIIMAEKWQDNNLVNSDLSVEKLEKISNSLKGIRTSDHTKLNLDKLNKHISYIRLKEATEQCKESQGEIELQQIISELYNKRYPDLEEDERYQDIVDDALDTLSQYYEMWANNNFSGAEGGQLDLPGIVTERWLNGSQHSQMSSARIDKIGDAFSTLNYAQNSEAGRALFQEMRDICFSAMMREAKSPDEVDNDSLWWERLRTFYNEDNQEDNNRQGQVVKLLDEAFNRDCKYAKEIMMEILQSRHNVIPEEARRQSGWSVLQGERLKECVKHLLGRYVKPEDLGVNNLVEAWKDDYENEYSSEWGDLKRLQIGYEGLLKDRLNELLQKLGKEERIQFFEVLWNVSIESEKYMDPNRTSEIEKNFVVETLKKEYDELWKISNKEDRERLDALADNVQQKSPFGLERTLARGAQNFLRDYQTESSLSVSKIKEMIRKISQQPEWIGWLKWNEIDSEKMTINRAVSTRDITSAESIGCRLVHDLAVDGEKQDGRYWRNVVSDVMGSKVTEDTVKGKICTPDGGKVLNALAYLACAASEIDQGEAFTTKDLKKYFLKEYAHILEEVDNKEKLGKLWKDWEKLFPDQLKAFMEMET